MKNLKEVSDTMPPTQGQKWSIFSTQRSTSLQWWVRSSLGVRQVEQRRGRPSELQRKIERCQKGMSVACLWWGRGLVF